MLESTLAAAGWDVPALSALGKVEFENTRNLGCGKKYSHFRVPGGGYMFSSFEFNHAYEDTDVLVSLAKLKNHAHRRRHPFDEEPLRHDAQLALRPGGRQGSGDGAAVPRCMIPRAMRTLSCPG